MNTGLWCLPVHYEARMHVDTCLRVVPRPAGSAVLVVGAVATAVACVFVVEDIVDLAKQLNLRKTFVLLQR